MFKKGTKNDEERSTEGEEFCQTYGNKLHVRKTITQNNNELQALM